MSERETVETPVDAVAGKLIDRRSGDPLSRKLGYGAGVGGALAILICAGLDAALGYQATPDVVAALSTVISVLIGRFVIEDPL